MLFQETDTPGVYRDDTGQMWPLGPREVTALQNSGSIVPRQQASGGGGTPAVPAASVGLGSPWTPGPAPAAPPPVKRDFQAIPQPSNQDWQFNAKPKAPQGVQSLEGPSMLSRVSPPQQSQPEQGRSPNLQRVTPREAQRQPQDQRFYKQVPGTPGDWVDTARQTSGWTPEQQEEMRKGVMQTHQLRQDAANMQYQASYQQAEAEKFRAEAEKGAKYNEMLAEQQKLDAQNLYIENQQKKIGEQLKAARERRVDPSRALTGDNSFAGMLAILGSALGQYSAGINGGPNNALALMNNMIERDVNDQLRLINEEKEGALMSRDELNAFQFQNNEEKKALIRAIRAEAKQAEIDSIAADKALVAVHPMAAQMRAALEEQKNQDLGTINSAISRTTGERFQPARAGGVVDVTEQVLAKDARESGLRKTIRENTDALTGAGTADKDTVMVDGRPVGKTPDAKEVNAQIRAYMTLKQKRDTAVKMIREGSFLDDARYEALVNDAMFDLAGSKGATVRSDTDVEQFGSMLGGTSRAKLRPENQVKIWNDNVRRAGNEVRNRLRQLGLPADAIEPDEMLQSE